MYGCLTDQAGIEGGLSVHGAAPNARANLVAELNAAQESVASGLYITWQPHPSAHLGPSAADEIKDGTGQCCRVGSASSCMCGHALSDHQPVNPRSAGYIKPPKCTCVGFNYAPAFPEECGQWWLARRGNFDISTWRKRVRDKPQEYACIGCEISLAEHETIFESTQRRGSRGGMVGADYLPLQQDNGGDSLRRAALAGPATQPPRNPTRTGINDPVRRNPPQIAAPPRTRDTDSAGDHAFGPASKRK
jgi:hypothetical protein